MALFFKAGGWPDTPAFLNTKLGQKRLFAVLLAGYNFYIWPKLVYLRQFWPGIIFYNG